MRASYLRSAMIASALLLTSCAHEQPPSTASKATPSGFCDRTPQPPKEPVGRISKPWADFLTTILGNYDCTCPGGKYYGKNDKLCRPQ